MTEAHKDPNGTLNFHCRSSTTKNSTLTYIIPLWVYLQWTTVCVSNGREIDHPAAIIEHTTTSVPGDTLLTVRSENKRHYYQQARHPHDVIDHFELGFDTAFT